MAKRKPTPEQELQLTQLLRQIKDVETVVGGAQAGLITPDELGYAVGRHKDVAALGTMFPADADTGALAHTARHVRFRSELAEEMQSSQLDGEGRGVVSNIADFLQLSSEEALRGLSSSVIGLGKLLRPLNVFPGSQRTVNGRDPLDVGRDRFLDALGVGPAQALSDPLVAGEPDGAQTPLQFLTSGADYETIRELVKTQRAIAAGANDEAGTLAKLSFSGGLQDIVGEAINIIGLTMATGATGTFTRGAGVGARTLGTTTPGLKSLGKAAIGNLAAAGLGASFGWATAPEDADGTEKALRALSGGGLAVFGASVAFGRPFGAVARAANLTYNRNAAVIGKEAVKSGGLLRLLEQIRGGNRLAGSLTASQLERYTFAHATKRAAAAFGAGLTVHPRLTVGYLGRSGAAGAIFGATRALDEGKSNAEAIMEGVLMGGEFIGGDFLFSRIGGVARATALQTLWSNNTANAFLKLGFSPEAAQATAGGAQLAQRMAIGGLVGNLVSGEEGIGAGTVTGALVGIPVIGKLRSSLYGALPRETLVNVMSGQFGKLTREEVISTSELIMQHVASETAFQSRDPVVRSMLNMLVGEVGETMPLGLPGRRAVVALPPRGEAPLGLPEPEFQTRVVGGRGGRIVTEQVGGPRPGAPAGGPIPRPSGRLEPTPAGTTPGELDLSVRADTGLGDAERQGARLAGLASTDQRGARLALPSQTARQAPELSSDTVGHEIARIKQRQGQIIQAVNELEELGASPSDPRILTLAHEYAGLRDHYASILQRGSQFPTRAQTIAPVSAVQATREAAQQFDVMLGSAAQRSPAIMALQNSARLSDDVLLGEVLTGIQGNAENALSTLVRGARVGAKPPGSDPLLRVTRAGSSVGDSISPSSRSGAPVSLQEARAIGDELGAKLHFQPQGPFTFTDQATGSVLASGRTIRDALQQLGAKRGVTSTTTSRKLLGGGAGLAALAPGLEAALSDIEGDAELATAGVTPFGWLAAAGAIGLLLTLKRGGRRLNATASRVAKFYRSETLEPLARTAAKDFGTSTLKRSSFFRLSPRDQLDHLRDGIRTITGRQNVSTGQRQVDLEKFLLKYTPSEIPPALWDDLERTFRGGARAAGYTDEQALVMLRGFLNRATTPYTTRPAANVGELFSLGRDAKSPFTTAEGWTELQAIAREAAAATSALPRTGLEGSAQVLRETLRARFAPTAKYLRDLANASDMEAYRTAGINSDMLTRPFGSIRPMEQIRNAARALKDTNPGVAQVVESMYEAVRATDDAIMSRTATELSNLKKIFTNLTDEDKIVVGKIMGGGDGLSAQQWRARFTGTNDRVIRAADRARSLVDRLAQQNGLNPNDFAWIEDYFPWYYSQRSVREIRRAGGPEEAEALLGIGGLGISETKFFRSLQLRSSSEQLAPTIENAHEALTMYVVGAIRKYHLDRLAPQVSLPRIQQLAREQPVLARQFADWIKDIHGVPSTSELTMRAQLTSFGNRLFNGLPFAESDMVREAHEFFINNMANPRRLSSFVRGSEFWTKIGFNPLSAMVNITQTVLNTGTDHSLYHILGGSMRLGQGKLADVAERHGMGILAPLIDPNALGRDTIAAVRESGVFGSAFSKTLDDVAKQYELALTKKRPVSGAILGTTLGVGAGAFTDSDDLRVEGAVGALAGAAVGRYAPRVVAHSLRGVKQLATGLFNQAEVLNRSIAHEAAIRGGERARRLAASGRLGGVGDRIFDASEHAAVGAAAGATVAGEDNRLEGAVTGATLLGGAKLFTPTNAQRIAGELDDIARARASIDVKPLLQQRLAADRLGRDDVLQWYARMSTDATQFRFGRNSRGRLLRTPVGEAIASLQTFTINQAEFTGHRAGLFWNGVEQFARTGDASKLDTRIMKHVALWMSTGAALTAVSAGVDSEKGLDYWLSRIGLGFMPFVRYRQDRQAWEIEDLRTAFTGPFIDDLWEITQTVTTLMTDDKAAEMWDVQVDDLANRLVSLTRQSVYVPEAIAEWLDVLQLEGAADLAREVARTSGEAIARPASVARGGESFTPSTSTATSTPSRSSGRSGGRDGGRSGGR